MQRVVVGVSGGSGSGKTSLVKGLARRVDGPVTTLAFDDYYRDMQHLCAHERDGVNWDHPDSLDVDLFLTHLAELKAGRPVARPTYDFTTHSRNPGTTSVPAHPVVIIEGILLLAFAELRALLDVSVFVGAPDDVRYQRRLIRDVHERGRTPKSVKLQYHATVRPMYERYVEPYAVHADLVVPGDGDLEDNLTAVLTEVQRVRSGHLALR